MSTPLLQVEDLRVTFPGDGQAPPAVDGVSFTLGQGERVGLVGESGAGKSMTALSVIRLLPETARPSGRIVLNGTDVLALRRRELHHVRGRQVAMIFQDPVTCLSPSMKVGDQIAEAIRAHRRMPRRQARAQAVDLLARVGIPAPSRRAAEYPHRLSGGMAQRVMIAIAVSSEPDLILADEPTAALDVTIEAQIIELLQSLSEEHKTAVLLITHDLAVLARFAERILVMHRGQIVEDAAAEEIYYRPRHPYTQRLLGSVTRPDRAGGGRRPGDGPVGRTR